MAVPVRRPVQVLRRTTSLGRPFHLGSPCGAVPIRRLFASMTMLKTFQCRRSLLHCCGLAVLRPATVLTYGALLYLQSAPETKCPTIIPYRYISAYQLTQQVEYILTKTNSPIRRLIFNWPLHDSRTIPCRRCHCHMEGGQCKAGYNSVAADSTT